MAVWEAKGRQCEERNDGEFEIKVRGGRSFFFGKKENELRQKEEVDYNGN